MDEVYLTYVQESSDTDAFVVGVFVCRGDAQYRADRYRENGYAFAWVRSEPLLTGTE
jgi:hypothetical protein